MVVIEEVGVGLAAACCGGFRSGLWFGLRLLGWLFLWWFCGAFWLRFVPWVFLFYFIFWWLGVELWLVVVAIVVAMVRGDELEKLRPWRF